MAGSTTLLPRFCNSCGSFTENRDVIVVGLVVFRVKVIVKYSKELVNYCPGVTCGSYGRATLNFHDFKEEPFDVSTHCLTIRKCVGSTRMNTTKLDSVPSTVINSLRIYFMMLLWSVILLAGVLYSIYPCPPSCFVKESKWIYRTFSSRTRTHTYTHTHIQNLITSEW